MFIFLSLAIYRQHWHTDNTDVAAVAVAADNLTQFLIRDNETTRPNKPLPECQFPWPGKTEETD
uniref:HDC10503 n=1 Tax=Drosophila melanogaster TaxID=7227 RepID=Q6IL36_DROME|nr:TPA_inf: HDC10503 [Drosophila melanogaster]